MRTIALARYLTWVAGAAVAMAVGAHAYGCAGTGSAGAEAGAQQGTRLQGFHSSDDLGTSKAAPSDKEIALELGFAMQHKDQFDELMRETQDPKSKRYQHWLTPEEMHERFGESQAQFNAVEQWLGSQGFTITEKSFGKSEDYIKFKGTIGEVEKAFKVDIVSPQYGHFANKEDPAIPAQFVGVISSITGLSGELY